MHFEIFVEDSSGKQALEVLVPRILDPGHTYRIHPYRGVGHIPKNMKDSKNADKRILLDNLPKFLKGCGRTFQSYPDSYHAAVIVVCDLDDKEPNAFLADLESILNQCHPCPTARFCLAIEEGEAWFLGDLPAVRAAYPKAKNAVLAAYVNDSICGTWEKLADAVFPGGAKALARKGWQAVGAEKERWAREIAPKMNVEDNRSPSFRKFRDSIRSLAGA